MGRAEENHRQGDQHDHGNSNSDESSHPVFLGDGVVERTDCDIT
jgi:hypothetical protein